MRQILPVVFLSFLLAGPVANAGNGRSTGKFPQSEKLIFEDFNILSECQLGNVIDPPIFEAETTKQPRRSFYPGYSFNVLKKPFYAEHINNSIEIMNNLPMPGVASNG